MGNIRYFFIALVTVFGIFAIEARADFVEPVGLVAGQPYQLIFITADTIAATSTDINTYNTFVQQEAAMDPSLPQGVTWSAVISTLTVNADVNAPAYSVPLYWTSGYQDSYGTTAANFGGSESLTYWTDDQLYPSPPRKEEYGTPGGWGEAALMYLMVRYDQYGSFWTAPAEESPQESGALGYQLQDPNGSLSNPWYYGNPDPGSFLFTGTQSNGRASEYPAGSADVTALAYGVPGDSTWNPNADDSLAPDTDQLHLLALSSVITYEPVPEPTTISLALAALLVMGGHSFLQWRRAASARRLNAS